MVLSKIKYVVLYRPFRVARDTPMSYCLFNDVREAMSFEGSHRRVCSHIDTLKVDCELTESLLNELIATR